MEKGVWRTIKGRHVFIEDGETVKDAIKRVREGNSNIKKKTSEKQEDEDYKLYKQARENPESIDPMTENSTDWEALEKKYKDKYEADELFNPNSYRRRTMKEIQSIADKEDYDRLVYETTQRDVSDDELRTFLEGARLKIDTARNITKETIDANNKRLDQLRYKIETTDGMRQADYKKERNELILENQKLGEEYNRLGSKLSRTPGFENEDRSYAGWELYSDDPNRFKTSNQGQRVINSRENTIQGSNIDRTDATKLQMGHGISNEKMIGYVNRNKTTKQNKDITYDWNKPNGIGDAYRRAANSSIQKDEVAIATKIRKGNMNKDENTVNDTYFLGDEKKGYYVQFQDVEKRKYEDVNKYPHVSPKKESMTWARVWKDGENIYNKEHNKYEARAEVAKFLEGRSLKSQSQLIQSYIDRGYSKETAKKMAMKAIKIRKNK